MSYRPVWDDCNSRIIFWVMTLHDSSSFRVQKRMVRSAPFRSFLLFLLSVLPQI